MGGLVVNRFQNKNVLVTGAASGIGRATAVRLAAEGARVFGLGRDVAGLAETARLIVGSDRFTPFTADLTHESSLVAAVEAARTTMGSIDILANIAGMTDRTPADAVTVEQLTGVFMVNTIGPMLLCREVIPHLPDGSGVIVNVCSTAATQAHPGMSGYASSKAALLSYSLSLAAELGERRIRVVPISPGGVRTPMMDGTIGALDPTWYSRLATLWHEPGAPEDLAAAIAFAASADGAYLNGAEMRVDGGARSAM
ncbi:SDR family oxidoreductase [Nocardia speluncae]|uniref:SDR family oxidoreductase n=1 Tax=Nocardia speluncae TaxID=419477 RepID=A0A846XDG2_9NOCA|nr:SDR family oxidoreductase [Nocardia speluncae]